MRLRRASGGIGSNLPSASGKTHDWRTRADPLAALQAKALFEELQRRVRQWRASQGPGKEVYFEQERVLNDN
ncbi:MAG: hypothetical protein OXD30_01540 [Bryobacterales bacterium]|nr:hypothetical protein [Bryobacterales bacterium]